ncbi:MAG: tetratricopeptide repeat protein [Acidobacteriota bacterium]
MSPRPLALHPIVGLLFLAALVLVAYGPTLGHGFVWDDHEHVVDNPHLEDASSLGRFFRTDVLSIARDSGERSNYYRPLFYVQYVAYRHAFGLDPRGWHAMALLWHLLASCAAWGLARRLGFSPAVALGAAALFALHPAHGESVSWVAAAFNDPPVAVALMLGLCGHLAHCRKPRAGRAGWGLGLGVLSYGLALLTKESALSMLLLVSLVELYVRATEDPSETTPGNGPAAVALAQAIALALLAVVMASELPLGDLAIRHAHAVAGAQLAALGLGAVAALRAVPSLRGYGTQARGAFLGLLPYLGLTVLYFYVRKLAIHTSFGVHAGAVDTGQWLATLPSLGLYYLRFLFWPWGFAPSYPARYVDGWGDPAAMAAALAWLAIAAAAAWWCRGRPVRWLGVLFVVACVWPVVHVRSFRPTYLVHQRYLYLAVFGLCLVLAHWALGRAEGAAMRRRFRLGVLGGLGILWTASLWHHNGAWASDVALWTRIAEVDPQNPASHEWLGARAMEEGRLDDAEAMFRRAVEMAPSSPTAHRNLAVLLHTRRGRPADALTSYEEALAAFTARPDLREEALEAEVNYGAALAQAGRSGDALGVLLPLARRPPHPPTAVRNAAVLLRAAGRLDDLRSLLALAVAQHPEDPTLGAMLRDVQRTAPAPGEDTDAP